MCGPKFCSMNISAKVESFTAADAEAVLNATPEAALKAAAESVLVQSGKD